VLNNRIVTYLTQQRPCRTIPNTNSAKDKLGGEHIDLCSYSAPSSWALTWPTGAGGSRINQIPELATTQQFDRGPAHCMRAK